MRRIAAILDRKGPLLSGELATELMGEYSISNAAARQAVRRASEPVVKLKHIKFRNGQRFVYLVNHFGSEIYYDRLLECIKRDAKAHYYILHALKRNHGFMNANEIATFGTSTVKPLKGHRLVRDILLSLEQIQLIRKTESGLYSFQVHSNTSESNRWFQANELAKEIVLNDFHQFLRKTNLIAYDSARLPEDNPEFHKFQWSFTAPSYARGLIKGGNPGFIVADIILDDKVNLEDVEYLLSKINIITQSSTHSPFIPMLILYRASTEAFNQLKRGGVALGFIDELFGKQYAQILKEISHTIKHASAIISKNPDQYFRLLSKIRKLEGRMGNIKGAFFELTVASYYKTTLPIRYLDLNVRVTVKETGKSQEIDVYVILSNEVRFVECKGCNAPLDDNYVNEWITKTIPNIRSWALGQEILRNKKFIFELWCTGGLERDAIERLKKAKRSTLKYTISYFGPQKIKSLMAKSNSPHLEEIIRLHFSPRVLDT